MNNESMREVGRDDASVSAAFVAAGIGALAMGLVVIANEAGIYTAPSLYGPAGGVSGRTTIAVVIWLVAWALLHRLWRASSPKPRVALLATIVMTVTGLVLTFPPVWPFFS